MPHLQQTTRQQENPLQTRQEVKRQATSTSRPDFMSILAIICCTRARFSLSCQVSPRTRSGVSYQAEEEERRLEMWRKTEFHPPEIQISW